MLLKSPFGHEMKSVRTFEATLLLMFFLLVLSTSPSAKTDSSLTQRPNILVITADDMGYTDIGSFGGEIRTPNLDALALTGVRLSNFHVGPACSPTRTMMMSGTYTEAGAIPGKGAKGRGRVLAGDVVALPQRMKDAGYHTYMSGKWHLGDTAELNPQARGFDASFALTKGGAEHFKYGSNVTAKQYLENGEWVEFPDGVYSTELYTDKMLDYLKAREGDGKPFFAWYTPTAPHWPIQVPDNYMRRYDGAYDTGYDDLLRKRLERAEEMGVLPAGISLENYPRTGSSWDALSAQEKRYQARIMELYAAMIENFDYHIGRIISYLKSTDQYDNTVIIFSSDNGSDPREGTDREGVDNSYENLGRANSWAAIGAWADAHSAPFKHQKGTQSEGGVRAPAFIRYPALHNQGGVDNRFITIMDFMPTFIELAGAKQPGTSYKGQAVLPIAGRSFAKLINGDKSTIVEHSSGSDSVWYGEALYKDQWKLVRPQYEGEWALYNLREDPSETSDLSTQNPKLFEELKAEWVRIGEEAELKTVPAG